LEQDKVDITTTVDSHDEDGWKNVAKQMDTWHPGLQEHAKRHLKKRGLLHLVTAQDSTISAPLELGPPTPPTPEARILEQQEHGNVQFSAKAYAFSEIEAEIDRVEIYLDLPERERLRANLKRARKIYQLIDDDNLSEDKRRLDIGRILTIDDSVDLETIEKSVSLILDHYRSFNWPDGDDWDRVEIEMAQANPNPIELIYRFTSQPDLYQSTLSGDYLAELGRNQLLVLTSLNQATRKDGVSAIAEKLFSGEQYEPDFLDKFKQELEHLCTQKREVSKTYLDYMVSGNPFILHFLFEKFGTCDLTKIDLSEDDWKYEALEKYKHAEGTASLEIAPEDQAILDGFQSFNQFYGHLVEAVSLHDPNNLDKHLVNATTFYGETLTMDTKEFSELRALGALGLFEGVRKPSRSFDWVKPEHYLAGIIQAKGKELRSRGEDIVQQKYGQDVLEQTLHLSELYDKYLNSKDKDSKDSEHNLAILFNMEKQIPGIGRFLEEDRGIIVFSRYDELLLIDQYISRDDTEHPYGVVLYPYSDGNGAFYDRCGLFDDLFRQTEDLGVKIRITERANKLGIARSLLSFDKQYGEKHKISFAIIGGHGTRSSIKFGDSPDIDEIGKLQISDLAGKGVKRALGEGFFTENPTIILFSCSTGAREGIAQAISSAFGGEVIAPDCPTHLESVKVKKDERGKLVFRVEYGKDSQGMKYMAGQEAEE
jgi:hypothetical protein